MKVQLGVLISGRGSNFLALETYASNPSFPGEIALVLSDQPDAPGLMAARNRFLNVAVCPRVKGQGRMEHERDMIEQLKAAGVTHLILAGFMRILSPKFLDEWQAVINIHPSILPKFPGLKTHERALAAGEVTHGCTVHLVDGGVDTGPILAQAGLNVRANETTEQLSARVLRLEHALFGPAIENFLRAQGLADPGL